MAASLLWEPALANWCYENKYEWSFRDTALCSHMENMFLYWVMLELSTIVAVTVCRRLIWFVWEWWKLRLWKTKMTVRMVVMMRTQLLHALTAGFCLCDVVLEKCVWVWETQLEITRELCHYGFPHVVWDKECPFYTCVSTYDSDHGIGTMQPVLSFL